MSYFLLYGVFTLWVLFDGLTRKTGALAVLWAIGTAIVGPIVLPIYVASRPLKHGEVREGGPRHGTSSRTSPFSGPS